MTVLKGESVTLRETTLDDAASLTAIRGHPEVFRWWGAEGDDLLAEVTADLRDPDTHTFAIELAGRVIGLVQFGTEETAQYRHASIDLFVDPAVRGRGLGVDAVRTLARHLIEEHGHHRIVIDPAAANEAAIRCYTKVGFRPVGIMRRYERGPDGTWHDGLLMDLLADELTP